MKSLVPWVCVLVASAGQQAFANDAFNAYRLGNYNEAAEPLIIKSGQDAVAEYYLGRLYLYGYGQLKTIVLRCATLPNQRKKAIYLLSCSWPNTVCSMKKSGRSCSLV